MCKTVLEEGLVATFIFRCCRHEKPLACGGAAFNLSQVELDGGSGGAAEASASAGAGAAASPAPFDGHLFVEALDAASKSVDSRGNKVPIGLGCPAVWKLVYVRGTQVFLVVRGHAAHNHCPESDDPALPFPPGMLDYLHEAMTGKRNPTAFVKILECMRVVLAIHAKSVSTLLENGPTDHVMAVVSPSGAACTPPSAERYHSRGIGRPPPVAADTIAAAIGRT